jgi:hypothetical protein
MEFGIFPLMVLSIGAARSSRGTRQLACQYGTVALSRRWAWLRRLAPAVSSQNLRDKDPQDERERGPYECLEYPITEGVLERLRARHAADEENDQAAACDRDVPAAGPNSDHRAHRADGDDEFAISPMPCR